MRNILANGQVGIIFLLPNAGETVGVSGCAEILVDPEPCASFAIDGRPASNVLSVNVQKAYYQSQKALVRSRLWQPAAHVQHQPLPSAGQMAQHFSASPGREFDAEAYDEG